MRHAFLLLLAASAAQAGVNISRVDGGVEVYLATIQTWRPITKVPYGLREGDQIRIKPLSSMRIEFEEGTVLVFSGNSDFTLRAVGETGTKVDLAAGSVEANVERYRDRVFEIETPAARLTLREDRVRVAVDPKKTTLVEVMVGLANVEPRKGSAVDLPEGFRIEAPFGKPMGVPVSLKEYGEIGKFSTPGPAGTNRRFDRKRVDASPAVPTPPDTRGAPRPEKPPRLGAESLGLPGEAKAAPPTLGAASLGVEPSLGPGALGVAPGPKPPPSPDPVLGIQALGLKNPGPDTPAPRRGSNAVKAPSPVQSAPKRLKPAEVAADSPLIKESKKSDPSLDMPFAYDSLGVKKPPRPERAANSPDQQLAEELADQPPDRPAGVPAAAGPRAAGSLPGLSKPRAAHRQVKKKKKERASVWLDHPFEVAP